MNNPSNDLLKIKLLDAEHAYDRLDTEYEQAKTRANAALREVEIDGLPFVFSSRDVPHGQSISRLTGCIYERDLPTSIRALYDRVLDAKRKLAEAELCQDTLRSALEIQLEYTP